MTALPEWLKSHDTYCDYDCDLKQALAIAWEALEHYGEMKGHNGEKVWTLVVPGEVAKNAMRRIEELGKE